jgi:predicted nucleotidyltransferase
MIRIMKPSEALRTHRADIRREVARNRVSNPRVFGSVLYGKDQDGSDLDLLVDPTPETSLMDIATLQNRLEELLGTPVDVLTPKALPANFRERVLAEAQPV